MVWLIHVAGVERPDTTIDEPVHFYHCSDWVTKPFELYFYETSMKDDSRPSGNTLGFRAKDTPARCTGNAGTDKTTKTQYAHTRKNRWGVPGLIGADRFSVAPVPAFVLTLLHTIGGARFVAA